MYKEKSIFPLLTFRVLFGLMMFLSTVRYFTEGWIEKLYIDPGFHFKYFGFHWVENPGPTGIYVLFLLKLISAALVASGLFYRYALIAFLISFAYLEGIDASNYLNHHYLVLLFGFLLLFVPANRSFSLDIFFNRVSSIQRLPAWCLYIFMIQISLVYFYAGLAKLNTDWLLHAMPLRIWLPQFGDWPLVGGILSQPPSAYLFSWFGALYDLSIWLFLWIPATRKWAYLTVVVFHAMTGALFNIGIFPYVMILSNLIFFEGRYHERFWSLFKQEVLTNHSMKNVSSRFVLPVMVLYFSIQIFFPLRHVMYPGNVLWTEEGYRFSWRVMLLEKFGQAVFYVEDEKTGRKEEVINQNFLTAFQEKQMAIQSDFILQYAQFLEQIYSDYHGIEDPVVTANIYVAINSRPAMRYVDSSVDLTNLNETWSAKPWIIRQEL
jgi:hypothetical protein